MTLSAYPPPIDKLLALPPPQGANSEVWPSYLELGLGPQHVPDLIRLALDEAQWSKRDDNPAVWAPVHAWRALAQLRAAEAVEPLLQLLSHIDLDQDDWIGEELPRVFQQIGPPAIPALSAFLTDTSQTTFARVAAGEGLKMIGQAHPEARAACAQALAHALEAPGQADPTVNGFAIAGLVELEAVEAAPAIERAFAAERVDEFVIGDWEDAQIRLGLKTERDHPREPNLYNLFGPGPGEPERPIPVAIRAWNEAVRAKKAAAEQAKAARKEKQKRKRSRGKAAGRPR